MKLSILISYWADKRIKAVQRCAETCQAVGIDFDLFIDSGAYSAKVSGAEIKVEDYAKYLEKIVPYTDAYANLDVIGGGAEANMQNQRFLEGEGFMPIPVHHFRESFAWLTDLLQMGYSRIALGGLVGVKKFLQLIYLEGCANILRETPNPPRVHLFGVNPLPEFVSIYPWDSYDSSSGWGFRWNRITLPSGKCIKLSSLSSYRNKLILLKEITAQLGMEGQSKTFLNDVKTPTRGLNSGPFWNCVSMLGNVKAVMDILTNTGSSATYYTVWSPLPPLYTEMMARGVKAIYENRNAAS